MRVVYWIIRYFVAIKNHDALLCMATKMKQMKTPLLLQFLGLELIEYSYENFENNPHAFSGTRWLIRKKSNIYDMSEPFTVWRIQGDDMNKKRPMVVWERPSVKLAPMERERRKVAERNG